MPSWLRKAAGVFLGMTLVNAGNYAINIVFARYLDPNAFGDVVFTTTWMLVLGAGSLALQAATARAVAHAVAGGNHALASATVHGATRLALGWGGAIALALALGARPLARAFQLSSAAPFFWLGAIAPALLYQGVRRGALQGSDRIGRFTATFQVEMVIRLVGSWVALSLGWNINGVCVALLLSVLASLASAGRQKDSRVGSDSSGPPQGSDLGSMMLPALVSQLSVIAFTQVDIIVVKARLMPREAGTFAVVVLLGRIISFATQAVSTPMVPAVVERVHRREATKSILIGAIAAVACIGAPLVAVALVAPGRAVTLLFGAQHLAAARYVGLYAGAMLVHGLACIVTDYAFCHGIKRVNYASAIVGLAKLVLAIVFVVDLASAVAVNLLSTAVLLVVTGVIAFKALSSAREVVPRVSEDHGAGAA